MSEAEIIELMWLDICGFNYIVRNENGSVEVFKNKPHRNHSYGCGYDTWVENKYPMTGDEMKRRKNTELGDYDFIHWIDEPILISNVIGKYRVVVNK